MKIKDFKNLSVEELARREAELRQELMNLRIQKASGQLENPARITLVRKAIARVQTVQRQHRSAAAPAR
ncbi:MAG: 50S ribosomal protein L29 [Verrucomicrobiales bacterium]